MAGLERLSEEEAYLVAILTDESGLDQAEFLWYAPDHEDTYGCFRAWPFQHKWWRDDSKRQIDQCARAVGKSLSLQVRTCAFPLLYPGQEMLLTAPETNHLEAVTNLIETRLKSIRFYRELLAKTPTLGIKHRPFMIDFRNGSRIMGRIPQRDGKGVKGMHPIWLEMDESQDYPSPGWTELFQTLKMEKDGARWRSHGVTRGVRDEFWRFTQPDSGWQVHRITAMHKPTWTDEERQAAVDNYGSENHPDYRRNILGLHGDMTNPLFVLHRLMRCVDMNAESEYNKNEFYRLNISDEWVQDIGGDITALFDPPLSHKKYKTVWIGMDIGLTNHPSEIVVFAEEEVSGKPHLKCIARYHLERISAPDQGRFIFKLLEFYNVRAFALDKTGIGLPIWQYLQDQAKEDMDVERALDLIKGYNFSQKLLVDFDETIDVEEFGGDEVEDRAIYKNALEYSSDKLRELVDNNSLQLPDDDMVQEFQGQTWTIDKSGMNMYGKKTYSKGAFHTLDAARMAACAWAQYKMEKFMREHRKVEKSQPVLDVFFG